MTAPVHFIELYADRGEIAPRLVCTATPDAPCRRRPTNPDAETWTDDDETTPGHDCWTTEFIDGVGFDESVTWGPGSGTLASVPVHVSYDHRGVLAEPVVLPDSADLLPVTAAGTPTPRTGETITTAAELDALPVGSVVLAAIGRQDSRVTYELALQRLYDGDWYRPGRARSADPGYIVPATVLFRPDAPQPATSCATCGHSPLDPEHTEANHAYTPATTDGTVERAARLVHEYVDTGGQDHGVIVADRLLTATLAAAGAGAEEWCADPSCTRDTHDHSRRDGYYGD